MFKELHIPVSNDSIRHPFWSLLKASSTSIGKLKTIPKLFVTQAK